MHVYMCHHTYVEIRGSLLETVPTTAPKIARLAQQAIFPLNFLPAKEGSCLLEGGWNSILYRYCRTGIHSLVPRQQPHLRSQAP